MDIEYHRIVRSWLDHTTGTMRWFCSESNCSGGVRYILDLTDAASEWYEPEVAKLLRAGLCPNGKKILDTEGHS